MQSFRNLLAILAAHAAIEPALALSVLNVKVEEDPKSNFTSPPSGDSLGPATLFANRLSWCMTCRRNPPSASLLYVVLRFDRSGMRGTQALATMALAAKLGLNFGGFVGGKPATDVSGELLATFGAKYSELFVNEKISFDEQYLWSMDMEHAAAVGSLRTKGARILLVEHFIGYTCIGRQPTTDLREYLTPSFLDAFRKQTAIRMPPAPQDRTRKQVAMHVRRGDLGYDARPVPPTEGEMKDRWLASSYYFELTKRLRRLAPTSELHAFTEVIGKDRDLWKAENISVHERGNVTGDWALMATADVFIMGASAFSFIPAWLSTKCVVYTKFCYPPLEGWIDGNDLATFDKKLAACLSRIH